MISNEGRGTERSQKHPAAPLRREQGTGNRVCALKPDEKCRLPVSSSQSAAHSSGCQAHNPLPEPTPSDLGSAQNIHTPRPRTDRIQVPV